MSLPMALSTIEIPGADPLYFMGSVDPPQISGQSLSKLLGSDVGNKLDDPTRGDTSDSLPSGAIHTSDTSIKRNADAFLDDETLGQTQARASTTVGANNDNGLAKEDIAGLDKESNSDEEEEETSTKHKKISDRRRAQNARFKSWYLWGIKWWL